MLLRLLLTVLIGLTIVYVATLVLDPLEGALRFVVVFLAGTVAYAIALAVLPRTRD